MNKKPLKINEIKAFKFIRNSIIHNSYSPSVRDVMEVLKLKSPRSALIAIDGLIEKGYLKRRQQDNNLQILKDLPQTEDHSRTVDIPMVGYVSCGKPMLAEENIEAMIPVSEKLVRPGSKYFLLRAMGDSMNKAGIRDGDMVLVRQQPAADNGEKVVALINDEATIKEYQATSEAVVLKPCSTNKKHKPIILTDNFEIQGVVIKTIPNF